MRYRIVQSRPAPGTCVRFTREFLSATSQERTPEWTTVECACELCAKGRHVAVNEPSLDDGISPRRPRWRHISYRNLERVTVPEEPPPTVPK